MMEAPAARASFKANVATPPVPAHVEKNVRSWSSSSFAVDQEHTD